jgi:hypothetical protein
VTAAVALAVVLVIAVAGMSLAMQTQKPVAQQSRGPARPVAPRRARERRPPPPEPSPPPGDPDPTPTAKGPELLRTGAVGEARVLSVVDERTVGSLTRSRLVLAITPADGAGFEATIRVAFPTAEARSKVQIGATVPVRYDPDDHARVVLDLGDD